ncbi:MAG TPA: ABC transporter permease [Terracidiphilus sp.]|nr:ABC transporter permease [Terracidiphilus sp.]
MSTVEQPQPATAEDRHSASFEQTLRSARRTMVLSEILKIAIDSFRAGKVRFMLTALGMVIGTASVILVVTIGLTGKEFILAEIQKIGTNEIELEYAGGGASGTENVVYNDYLTRQDEKAVDEQLPGVMYSSPVMEMHDPISFGGGVVKDTLVLGVAPEYQYIRNLLVPYGRFFDQTDEDHHIYCADVTEAFARERYGSNDAAVGQQFEISGIPFTIIGVFKESGEDFGQTEIADQTILTPISVAAYFQNTENVKQIYFSMRSMEEVPTASKEIVRIVKARHRPNSVYKTQDLREVLNMARKIANIITAVLVLVAAVTLAVGGVGIMNIMLATVRSRIREIGIRKALGATRREIKLQFLAEAVIISLSGGIVGILVGLMLPLSVDFFSDYNLPINIWSIVIALASAMFVGIVFGTVPATRAAQMDPVESLKYE